MNGTVSSKTALGTRWSYEFNNHLGKRAGHRGRYPARCFDPKTT